MAIHQTNHQCQWHSNRFLKAVAGPRRGLPMTASQDDMPPPKGIPVRKMIQKMKVEPVDPFVLQKVILQRSSKAKLTQHAQYLGKSDPWNMQFSGPICDWCFWLFPHECSTIFLTVMLFPSKECEHAQFLGSMLERYIQKKKPWVPCIGGCPIHNSGCLKKTHLTVSVAR